MLPRSALKPRRQNAPRPAEKSARGYLQWLRGRECFVGREVIRRDDSPCDGKMQAAHTYGAGDKGIGTKSSDAYAIPLCAGHHAEQHRLGWHTFEGKYGFNAPMIARTYWSYWPGRRAWEAKQDGK